MATLKGGSLLAALHNSLERIKTIRRVCRALSKRPQLRTAMEVGYIMAETERLALMTREGPGVHRDLCHVARLVSLKEMDSMKLPPPPGVGAAHASADGRGPLLYIYVLTGRVQLRTRHREAFSPRLAPLRAKAGKEGSGGEGKEGKEGREGGGEGALQRVSEDEMRALFNSIDVDGSGAIDVSELQTALELLGIRKSAEEVEEMMDGVDEDGSGELEFDEFKAILRKAVEGGSRASEWHEAGGLWSRELGEGTAVGEAALLDAAVPAQDASLMALGNCDLLLLERHDYERILESGFDGELQAKMGLLRAAPVLGDALRRTDLRMLAYAMVRRTAHMNAALYEQGQPPTSLDLIVEGNCKVVVKMPLDPPSAASSRRGTELGLAAPGGAGPPCPSLPGSTPVGAAAAAVTSIAGATAAAAAAAAAADEAGVEGGGGLGGSGDSFIGAFFRRGCYRLAKPGGRPQRLEVAVLGPGDMCSEASVLGEERQPHSCVVSSQDLTVLSLSLRDMKKLVHPADLATLRDHFERRIAQRSNRMAVAASVATMAAGELGRLRRGSQHAGHGGKAAAAGAAAAAGPFGVPLGGGSFSGSVGGGASPRVTLTGLDGGGGDEGRRPGTVAATLDRLAAVMRGKSRPSHVQSSNSFSSGAGSFTSRRTATGMPYGDTAPLAGAGVQGSGGSMPGAYGGIGAASGGRPGTTGSGYGSSAHGNAVVYGGGLDELAPWAGAVASPGATTARGGVRSELLSYMLGGGGLPAEGFSRDGSDSPRVRALTPSSNGYAGVSPHAAGGSWAGGPTTAVVAAALFATTALTHPNTPRGGDQQPPPAEYGSPYGTVPPSRAAATSSAGSAATAGSVPSMYDIMAALDAPTVATRTGGRVGDATPRGFAFEPPQPPSAAAAAAAGAGQRSHRGPSPAAAAAPEVAGRTGLGGGALSEPLPLLPAATVVAAAAGGYELSASQLVISQAPASPRGSQLPFSAYATAGLTFNGGAAAATSAAAAAAPPPPGPPPLPPYHAPRSAPSSSAHTRVPRQPPSPLQHPQPPRPQQQPLPLQPSLGAVRGGGGSGRSSDAAPTGGGSQDGRGSNQSVGDRVGDGVGAREGAGPHPNGLAGWESSAASVGGPPGPVPAGYRPQVWPQAGAAAGAVAAGGGRRGTLGSARRVLSAQISTVSLAASDGAAAAEPLPQLTLAGALAKQPSSTAVAAAALEYGTAAAAVSGWFPAPPRLAEPPPGAQPPRPKWSVARAEKALAEGLAVMEEAEAQYTAAAAAATAAVQATSAAIASASGGGGVTAPGAGPGGGAGAAASAAAVSGAAPPPPRRLESRGLDSLRTPPMSPDSPRLVAAAGEFGPSAAAPAPASGGSSEAASGDEDDGDDEWGAPLLSYDAAAAPPPSHTPPLLVSPRGTPAAPLPRWSDPDSAGAAGGGSAGPASAERGSRSPGPALGPARASSAAGPPRPLGIPKLALHKLALGGGGGGGGGSGGGSDTAGLDGGGGDASFASLPPGYGNGASPPQPPAATARQPSPAGRNMAGSVQVLLRGWQTSRAASSAAEASAAAAFDAAAAVNGGAATARPAARLGHAVVSADSPRAPAGAAAAATAAPTSGFGGGSGGGGGASWSKEAMAAAVVVSAGERGRLAAIYSGLLRRGEQPCKASMEAALLSMQQQQQQAGSAQRRQQVAPPAARKAPVLRALSTSMLLPTAHQQAWPTTPTLAAGRNKRGPLPNGPVSADSPAAAAGSPRGPLPRASPQAPLPPGGSAAAAAHLASEQQLQLIHSVVAEASGGAAWRRRQQQQQQQRGAHAQPAAPLSPGRSPAVGTSGFYALAPGQAPMGGGPQQLLARR